MQRLYVSFMFKNAINFAMTGYRKRRNAGIRFVRFFLLDSFMSFFFPHLSRLISSLLVRNTASQGTFLEFLNSKSEYGTLRMMPQRQLFSLFFLSSCLVHYTRVLLPSTFSRWELLILAP